MVSPKGEVTQYQEKGTKRGKETALVYSGRTLGRWLPQQASRSFTLTTCILSMLTLRSIQCHTG